LKQQTVTFFINPHLNGQVLMTARFPLMLTYMEFGAGGSCRSELPLPLWIKNEMGDGLLLRNFDWKGSQWYRI